jgi:hypothetical protein
LESLKGGSRDPGQGEVDVALSAVDEFEDKHIQLKKQYRHEEEVVPTPNSPLSVGESIGLEILADSDVTPPQMKIEDRLEESVTWKDLGIYALRQLLSQLQAVVPVSIYFTVFLACVFQRFLTDILPLIGGLLLVIIGLSFFLEGLKIFFMPLSERIGWKLPLKLPLGPVCAIVTCLGVLCTYAEPAINALVPLGELVPPYEAPYLYWIMNPWRGWLVLSIGFGVGLSLLLGTLRLKLNWKLNPMLYITLLIAIGPAIYLQWVNPNLRKLVPLAWDIGVVATGPVTVPITLALGSGIAMSSPSLQKNPLSGFGLVALASLYPIITVQLLMLLLSFYYSRDALLIEIEILLNQESTTTTSVWDASPYQELILSLRSILPLAALLLVILLIAVREELPVLSWYQLLKADREAREGTPTGDENEKVHDEETGPATHHNKQAKQQENDHETDEIAPRLRRGSSQLINLEDIPRRSLHDTDDSIPPEEEEEKDDGASDYNSDDDRMDEEEYAAIRDRGRRGSLTDSEEEGDMEGDHETKEAAPKPGFFDSWRISVDVSRAYQENPPYAGYPNGNQSYASDTDNVATDTETDAGSYAESATETEENRNFEEIGDSKSRLQRFRARSISLFRRHGVFLFGLAFVQIGCLLFNWGIVYGLTPLSLQVGGWLPTAYMHVNGILSSPQYSYAIGVLFVLVFGFLLGALVTLAEPGMAVFCRQVTSLTHGEIDTAFLMSTVSVGVGAGLGIGLLTIVFHIPTLYIVLGGYPFAVLLTAFTPNVGLSAVAWDAAGTVTGPVTTPLVLSIGLAFGKRDPLVDGFGVLTCASIFPIISILAAKKIMDVFSGLKEQARMTPPIPGQMGVLSATLRWDEPDTDHQPHHKRRHRHKHHKHHKATEETHEVVELDI